MPVIKPFKGLKPGALFVEKVVLNHIDNPFSTQHQQWLQTHPESFLHLLNPEIDLQNHESRFGNIIVKLKHFLQQHILERDHKACFYIYRLTVDDQSSTGIWTCTLLDDYLNNSIKKHEFTQPEKEHQLYQFIQETGLDCIPVLITYKFDTSIDSVVNRIIKKSAALSFLDTDKRQHELWMIDKDEDIEFLEIQFKILKPVYIADGHHRAAAFSKYGISRRKHNQQHNGNEEYNYFSSIYFPSTDLNIFSYSRLIKSELKADNLIHQIKSKYQFESVAKENCFYPSKKGEFGLFANGQWYKFYIDCDDQESETRVDQLDVSILQKHILEPLFEIDDPRNNKKLGFAPGTFTCRELTTKINAEGYNYAITLYPISVDELMAVADAGEIMPPKSTWFEPKMPLGLVTHFID
ncbi:hypothetical protein C3K47_06405 [Solitalea longa]|uniref:DUF1015 domain-containing protein n=1 Tax=Solitalea longa TaxID=2079460 RepID=A0A2S5A506_9SPHI|nr:DUF1015 family protein [Solitalea longa]POY37389.1 hypothetical protein C3K47_06405 [Solitalea longa]